jgi:ketosteroid isomerase-like protein
VTDRDRTREALSAVDQIVADFANHRRDAYFTGFALDATFLFPAAPHRLESRAAYEQLWDDWEGEHGFRVWSCVSSNRRIQLFEEMAVFSHDVDTVLELDGATETLAERETIVLEYRGGAWFCVHEHLSSRA